MLSCARLLAQNRSLVPLFRPLSSSTTAVQPVSANTLVCGYATARPPPKHRRTPQKQRERPTIHRGRPVHVRYKEEVVRFVIPATATIEKVLEDAKRYFGIADVNDVMLFDLASSQNPNPQLSHTISDLDSTSFANFFFQLQVMNKEQDAESELGTNEFRRKRDMVHRIQREEYFTKHLFAKKILVNPQYAKEQVVEEDPEDEFEESAEEENSQEFEGEEKVEAKEEQMEEETRQQYTGHAKSSKQAETLVRSLLFSKRFKRRMTELRMPPLSDASLSAFISTFMEELANTNPALHADVLKFSADTQSLVENIIDPADGSDSVEKRLRQVLMAYLPKGAALHATIAEENEKRQYTDLRKPWMWYKAAREMKRHFVIHTGPTNSGKTYHALERLMSAESGVYCGPLRLLAHEVYEKITARGVTCALITGQQRIEPMFATHKACTIEMADISEPIEVAVVDEFQMIGEMERGWAWTRAILGLPAKEIHLCGDGTAVKLVTQMCTEFLGDSVEVREYKRLSPLHPIKSGLQKSAGIQAGDCVVAFSRKEIHAIRQQIEKDTGFRCCMVYGSLPPESRSLQAALFNDPNSGFDVLVASDAIGMGLNLNIRRIIFSSIEKYDGTQQRTLTDSEIKQISGRAGRYGSIYPEGLVTCLSPADSLHMYNSLQSSLAPLDKAGLSPTYEQLEMFYLADKSKPTLATLLDRFAFYASLDTMFFFCDYSNVREIAVLLENLDLNLKDMYTFCLAPADTSKSLVKYNLYKYAASFAAKDKVVSMRLEPTENGPALLGMPHLLEIDDDREKLRRLEELYQVADSYIWLSYRLERFEEREKGFAVKEQLHKLISELLDSSTEEREWMEAKRAQHEFRRERHLENERRRPPRGNRRDQSPRQHLLDDADPSTLGVKEVRVPLRNIGRPLPAPATVTVRHVTEEVKEGDAEPVKLESLTVKSAEFDIFADILADTPPKPTEPLPSKHKLGYQDHREQKGHKEHRHKEIKVEHKAEQGELKEHKKDHKTEHKELKTGHKTEPHQPDTAETKPPQKHKGKVERKEVDTAESAQIEQEKYATEMAAAKKEVEKWKAIKKEAQQKAAKRANQGDAPKKTTQPREVKESTEQPLQPEQSTPQKQSQQSQQSSQQQQQQQQTSKLKRFKQTETQPQPQNSLHPQQQHKGRVDPNLDLNAQREQAKHLFKKKYEQSSGVNRIISAIQAADKWRQNRHESKSSSERPPRPTSEEQKTPDRKHNFSNRNAEGSRFDFGTANNVDTKPKHKSHAPKDAQ